MGLITRDRSGFDLPASVPGPAFCRFFFFSSRRRHTRSLCDWSSDVCSSDLGVLALLAEGMQPPGQFRRPAIQAGVLAGARLGRAFGVDELLPQLLAALDQRRPGLVGVSGDRKSVV